MQVSSSTLLVAVVVLGAGAFALLRDPPPPDAIHAIAPSSDQPPEDPDPGAGDPNAEANQADPEPDDEPPAMAWTVPAAWRTLPNPSAMRIATYGVPRVAGDSADAEVSVTRAGGDVDANVERWASQFAGGSEPRRSAQTVHGFRVTVVEIEGTFTNAMVEGARPQPAWALLAAIVHTPGQPYFFKMVGPVATVHAARPAMQGLLGSLRAPAGGEGGPAGVQVDASRHL
jgi:hypothetical protein